MTSDAARPPSPISIVNEPNRYKLELLWPFLPRGYPEFVTLTTPDPRNLLVLSPTYLVIHAACAKVTRLSGAAARIDKLYRNMQESETFYPNGTSASMSKHAILELHAAGH
ncbi:hypothetical protein CVT25_002434 [Psilocybe cyanescens]|uniref:HNH nuclease domain-containing protein n=1 Tax=Psilocybe cyanescens TaxID=93625 RepID=A0A409WK18_PSICY|nr:hypothetical protein CVT25_002434 [Psilocybe cyanescens]